MKTAYLNLDFFIQLKLWFNSIFKRKIALLPVIMNQTLPFKNVMITGKFFPLSETALRNELFIIKANIQSYMTVETDVLICGKHPDRNLVEEARIYGVEVLYINKIGEIVGLMQNNDIKSWFDFHDEEPLGI